MPGMHLPAGNRTWFHLHGLMIHASIGILPHERRRKQPVRIDLDVMHTLPDPQEHLEASIDYDRLHRIVTTIMTSGHIDLVESAVNRIAEACLEVPHVHFIRLRLLKTEIYDDTAGAGMTIERFRISSGPDDRQALPESP